MANKKRTLFLQTSSHFLNYLQASTDNKIFCTADNRIVSTADNNIVSTADNNIVSTADNKIVCTADNKIVCTADNKIVCTADNKISLVILVFSFQLKEKLQTIIWSRGNVKGKLISNSEELKPDNFVLWMCVKPKKVEDKI